MDDYLKKLFSVAQPQIFVEIDREKAKAQLVSLDDVNNTLQSYLGSYYVNDFTFQNRNWQVNIQADPKFRMRVEDIGRLEVRNIKGDRVPLATIIKVKNTSGPAIVNPPLHLRKAYRWSDSPASPPPYPCCLRG